MVKYVTGVIGLLMLAVFLGFYIVRVDAPPLWIVMIGCAAMAAYDLLFESRRGRNGDSK